MKTDDPSVHCDCRQKTVLRVRLGACDVMILATAVWAYLLCTGRAPAAHATHLIVGLAIANMGAAPLFLPRDRNRRLYAATVIGGILIILFDLWILFLR